jgi:periplasmic divalent cation tolerance protein
LELAKSAVQARLAAGALVNGPAASVFWHAGEFGTGEEWVLTLKTTSERYPELEAHLLANHPWTNPELTAVPIAAAPLPYLDWVARSVSPKS